MELLEHVVAVREKVLAEECNGTQELRGSFEGAELILSKLKLISPHRQ